MKRPERKRRRTWRPSLPARPKWLRLPARPGWTRFSAWKLPRPKARDLRTIVARLTTPPDVGPWRDAMRGRIAAFARSRWGRRLAIGAAATGVAAVGAVGWVYGPTVVNAIADHPYFTVTEIVVTPTQHVRAGTLLESVDLRAGVSLWRVDPATLAARLEAQPWIRRAKVRREFPRRLIVDLAEREPVAILFLDQLYYVDNTGVAFVKVGERDRLDVPFVTGVEAAIVADERPFARHSIRQALRLLQLMKAAGLPFRVSEVHIDREQGITVFPIEPRVALTFGWSGFGTKLTRLARVLQDFRGRESQIREIDLTMGTAAVVRLRQPGAVGKRTRA
jgi:cell division protein FtsQ